jgi:hypothetical protein
MKIQTDDQARQLFIKFGAKLRDVSLYQPTTWVLELASQWYMLEAFIHSEPLIVTTTEPEMPEHSLDTIKV